MADSILYKLKSGKPNKAWFMFCGFIRDLVPDTFYRCRLHARLAEIDKRTDAEYIRTRVAYYNKLVDSFVLPTENIFQRERSWAFFRGSINGFKRKMFHTAYYLDQRDFTKWFPKRFRWAFCPGDVYFTPKEPCVVKSRLLTADNDKSVVMKLDKQRHFMFVNDPISFKDKQDKVIFRGKIRQSRVRTAFLERFFNHPMFDCGVVGRNEGCPDEWMTAKKTIREHLDYKFIMALEGNDVASNLKWVMSSNSLAIMTRPTCETWFMEGTLKPGYHYVEVREDFADLEEKIQYYIAHPDEAEAIVQHAHEYVAQFRDEKREELIQLAVMDRYLRLSGQYK